MRRQVQLLCCAWSAEPLCSAHNQRHDQRDARQYCEEEPGKDLRAWSAPEAERCAQAILIYGAPAAVSSFASAGVSLIADIEDCTAGHLSPPSNSSVSSRRRGARRRRGACASTSASRTTS